ncbi:MAG: slipin family protein [Acaryochloridaceae cyanobacterium RL_2_7]|nr:slipin family protein [Acaryochloridaceae cyanobacterium RL_2_7]
MFFQFSKPLYQPYERGVLYDRGVFKGILTPGTHRRVGLHWSVKLHDIGNPEAQLDHLEFLMAEHSLLLNAHVTLVQTQFDEVALIKQGQEWFTVPPNQLRAFWKGVSTAEVTRFKLSESVELAPELVPQLKDRYLSGLYQVQIKESQMGLLYDRDNFVRPLEPGDYGFWNFNQALSVQTFNRTEPAPNFSCTDTLIEKHPDFVQDYCVAVQLSEQKMAIVRHRGKVIAILPPCCRQLFWQGVEVETIDLDQEKLSTALVAELVSGLPETLELALPYLYIYEIPARHVGILSIDGAIQEPLEPGLHVWWQFGKTYSTQLIDLRLQTLEVSGQEILSKDKVSLRINLTAGYRVTHPTQAVSGLKDIEGFLYKELQFAIRSAVGTRSLDHLLEHKDSMDDIVRQYIQPKAEAYGITIDSVGVKDIILPGDMKDILCQVVEAEKSAQANVIRRREETAATRSMLNTAKVMENNPVALRLKELEVLERIADKIEHIHVNGSLDSLLTELIRINPPR